MALSVCWASTKPPPFVEALKRLEYRGYDSAGIATVNGTRLDRRRAVGKLVNLSDLLVHDPLPGKAGIGHTRWATHGPASVKNAHPHCCGSVSVVHNGIIENFRDLRAFLAERGLPRIRHRHRNRRHAGPLAHDQGATPAEAVERTLGQLTGAYALLFLFEGEDNLLIAARKGSPLAVGHGDGEMFVGSDAIALAPMTDRITYLEEGDWAVITREGATIRDAKGALANRPTRQIRIDATRIDKGGHKHFMAKEIAEQPVVLTAALDHYLDGDAIRLPGRRHRLHRHLAPDDGGLRHGLLRLSDRQILVRTGGRASLRCRCRLRIPLPRTPIAPGTLALFVSQSGETADTLAALRYCRDKADRIVSVVNVAESSIARESDLALPILAGTEIGVASTKAFTCQLTVLAVLALHAAHQRGRLDATALATHLAALRTLPGLVNQALATESAVHDLAQSLSEARDILFLGRGRMFPLALEGALKLKEISYIHAEAYASGELKHGPIALVDPSVPVIVMAPHDELFDKTVSNMQEVMARGGKVLLITDTRGAVEAGEGTWSRLVMPEVPAVLAPILYAVPAQLLAYHTAIAKGTDVDQPRNLAKSVTVE